MEGKWSSVWPNKPGVYLFYGYAINKRVEQFPRIHLVTVEYVSDTFGVQYRTYRHTIKKESGAYGMWLSVMVPELPSINENEASKVAGKSKGIKDVRFVE